MEPNIRACGEGWLQDEQRVLVWATIGGCWGFGSRGFLFKVQDGLRSRGLRA